MGTLGHMIFVPLNSVMVSDADTKRATRNEVELFFTLTIKKIIFTAKSLPMSGELL